MTPTLTDLPDATLLVEPPVGPSKPSIADVMNSLTGFDEVAIRQRWGIDDVMAAMSSDRFMTTTRALVFILERRAGKTDGEAYTGAFALPWGECQAMFAAEGEASGEAPGKASSQ